MSSTGESDDLGLKVLWSGMENGSQPACTIVLIHGLQGHRIKTWTSSQGFFWPDYLGQKEFPDVRILTFGYNDVLDAAAHTLLADLLDDRSNNDIRGPSPIILLGHSSGGTLAKQMYLLSAPTRNSRVAVQRLHLDIQGFVFLGTRHRGSFRSDLRRWINILTPLIWLFPSAEMRKAQINLFLDNYRRINLDFQHEGGEDLAMACFYEKEPTKALGILVSQKDATLDDTWVENRPLEGTHAQIGQVDSLKSPNYTRLITGIRSVYKQVACNGATTAPGLLPITRAVTENRVSGLTDENPQSAGPKLRVLALDGGGIRGLFAIIVLQRIMEEVRKIDCPESEDAPKPCDYFDLIGGTSTGGLLGVMLGRLRMDLVSCKLAYKQMSASIFKTSWSVPGYQIFNAIRGTAWYSGEALESAVKEIVSERLSLLEKDDIQSKREEVTDAAIRNPRATGTKTFMCAVIDQENSCERIRTYGHASVSSAASCSIWQACRATSAASLYFPPMTINERTYWDGGMNSNNPILEVIEEAKSEFGEGKAFQVIVSIGTGKPPVTNPSSHLFGVMKYAIKQMTDTQKKHSEFLRRYPDLVDDYYRFNEEGDMHKIDLADWQKLGRVEELATEYVLSVQGKGYILECARKLARSSPTVS
ncbi:acyl transferase/acyl hydrolase/lysophospholipase [Halenospora varia]|nr:acyl transferase/acyl hydrolase/lysophospholipase [Halenospora varia]